MTFRETFSFLSIIFVVASYAHCVSIGTGKLAPTPKPEDFLGVVGLDLTLDGSSARFWGTSVSIPDGIVLSEDTGFSRKPDVISRFVSRIKCRGDTILRIGAPARSGIGPSFNRLVADCNENGIRVWNGLSSADLGFVHSDDAVILDDPASAEDWRAAVEILAGDDGYPLSGCLARVWDPRMELLYIQRMRMSATRFNPESGLKYSEDPCVSIWELDSADRWRLRMLDGEWLSWPVYFKKLLIDRWNTWLYKRYGTQEAIETAWGKLLPGESIEDSTILLLPLNSDTDLDFQLDVLETVKRPEGEISFSSARRRDVVIFLQLMWLQHKTRVESHFRKWGTGTRRAPLFWQIVDGFPLPKDDANAMAMRLTLPELATLAALSTDEDRKAVRMSGKSVLSPVSKPCFLIVPPDNNGTAYGEDVPWHILYDHFGFSAVCWEMVDSITNRTNDIAEDQTRAPFFASMAAAGVLFSSNVGISGIHTNSDGISIVDDSAVSAVCGSCDFKASWRSPRMAKTGFSFAIRAPLREKPDSDIDGGSTDEFAKDLPVKPYANVSARFSVAAISPSGSHLADSDLIIIFFAVIPESGKWPESGYRLSIDPMVFKGTKYKTFKMDGEIDDKNIPVGTSQIEVPLRKNGVFRMEFSR